MNTPTEFPHDIPSEKVVLGLCLISKRALEDVAAHGLLPEDFYRPAHQAIYEAARHLVDMGKPVSAESVNAELARRGESVATGGILTLIELTENTLSPATAVYYANLVINQARLRRALQGAIRAAQIASEGRGDVDELIGMIAAEMEAATAPRATNDDEFMALGDIIPNVVDLLEKPDEATNAVPLPYGDLDALTAGLEPGEVMVVAGRPGTGKTTFAQDAVRHAAIRHNIPSVFFSLEMSKEELTLRVLCAESRVPLHTMKSRLLDEPDWERIRDARKRIADAPLMIDANPYTTTAHIRARLRGMARPAPGKPGPARLVVVDYLQLMKHPGRPENRQQEVSDISRELKLIAKEFGVGIILLAQLNRGPEQRQDKRPMVSDLRESGSVEQDSDMVVLLFREDVYDKESPRAGEQDIIVGKHRGGPTAEVTVAFQGHYCCAVGFGD
ncbi:replicative DNA helicase [Nocardiopsis sp. FR26]|uniref:replicative DNA helicase n=1 Tax=Nocardiopsis sp. FR26 TaxID=2605987 RepID=UPI001F3D69CF|nr:replicative DNA helicase [Nocardiopsis sp. FR26]